jgi:hypothetical protein
MNQNAPTEPTQRRAGPWFRAAVIVGATAGTLLWIVTLLPVVRNWNNPNADGMLLVPAFFATPLFVLFVLPALILGIFAGDRGLGIGALLLFLAAFIGTAIFF